CSSDKQAEMKPVSVDGLGSEVLNSADFDAYLKLKGIPNTPGSRLDRARSTFVERTALAEAISRENLLDKAAVEAELRDFRNELLITRYFEKFGETTVTPEAVKQFYDKNPELFTERKAHISQITFPLRPEMGEPQRKAQFARAVDTFNKIKAGGAFAAPPREPAETAETAPSFMDLGVVDLQQIDRAVADAVATQKKGAVTSPISTPSGYRIVKLLEDPVVNHKPFAEVEESVRYRLKVDEKNKETQRLLALVSKKEVK
ncbi:MAG TPA: peptidyl-prolyl cis-trans isomerase, partial [Steroidobacteraceae bacterium]